MKNIDKDTNRQNTAFISPTIQPTQAVSKHHLKNFLSLLLCDLEYVEQSAKYHPEGDALYHSLQVFQLATESTTDPELRAAALLHDVGKTADIRGHAAIGGNMLSHLLSPRACWLVAHHLHLLTVPIRTRKRLRGTKALAELEQLRRWDLGGRQLDCAVPTSEQALDIILEHYPLITSPQSDDIYSRIISA